MGDIWRYAEGEEKKNRIQSGRMDAAALWAVFLFFGGGGSGDQWAGPFTLDSFLLLLPLPRLLLPTKGKQNLVDGW